MKNVLANNIQDNMVEYIQDNMVDNMIDDKGNYNYAYITMLVKNDIYGTASIVLAESLRKIGCLGDLVIMVDDTISLDILEMVKKFYNRIIKIKLIEIKHKDSTQQIILSKIYSLGLTQYEKIFLIDIDTIFFTNIDKYFINNSYSENNCKNKDNNNCPSICYFENKPNYSFILVKPSGELLSKSIKIIKKYKKKLSNVTKPFEFVLNKLFDNFIKLDINMGLDNNIGVDIIQYVGEKPFLMSSSLTIEERIGLDHFKIWFSYFIDILNKYPELKKIKTIQETIDVSKYFLAPMSRFIIQLVKSRKNKKLEQITHIYGKHKYTNLDYYHLDISRDYSSEYINWISNINGIGVFLQYLTSQTKKDFLKYEKYKSSKKIIDYFKNSKNKYLILLDIFLNYYVKIFPNVFVVIKINIDTEIKIKPEEIKIIDEEFELKNNLVYSGKICLDGNILSNVVFNIFQNYTYSQKIELIKKISTSKEYTIDYYIYETLGQIDYFDLISYQTDLFVLFDKGSKIRFGSIFFNPNTLDMFKKSHKFCNYISYNEKNSNKIIDKKSLVGLIYFQTLKKWICSNYSGNEIENIIVGEIIYPFISPTKSDLDKQKIKLVLIDNITTDTEKIKKLNNNKIFFIKIIFLKTKKSENKNIIGDKKTITESIANPEFHWELENIKFLIKKFEFKKN